MDRAETRALTHMDAGGRAGMVDVSDRDPSQRIAVAQGQIRCDVETARVIGSGGTAKGDVLTTARIAGVMAAKRTADLIPMCHPLALTHIQVGLTVDLRLPGVRIEASVRCAGRTGVEMEALTAVTVAGLTVIDMAKSADRWMTLDGVGLLSKEGGKSGRVVRPKSHRAASAAHREEAL
ncbi:MAG: cyclic pyranopterin monophosphate synthase MoaC [Candidatus Dormibacteria bacterium]